MAITKFYMPLESLKSCRESRFWVSGKSVVLCTLNAPDFFEEKEKKKKTKDRDRLHIMWGSDFLFLLPRQRASIGNEFKQDILGQMKE